MAYTKVHESWEDGEAGETPIDATAMNTIEEGIEEAHNNAAAAQATADTAAAQQLPFVRLDTVNQKGDVIVGTSFGVVTRVGVGGTNQVLIPDASTPSGLAWANLDPSRFTGYPSDSAMFLRGDGTWAAPSGGIGPTFIGDFMQDVGMNPVANRAYLKPIHNLVAATLLRRIGIRVVTTGGSYDLGCYFSDDEATFTRAVSLGSTTLPSQGVQVGVLASTLLTPVAGRRWYLAAAFSSGSAGITGEGARPFCFFKDSSFPLPASLTSMTAITGESSPSLVGAV